MSYTYKIEIIPSRERVIEYLNGKFYNGWTISYISYEYLNEKNHDLIDKDSWGRMRNWLKINHPEMML